MLTASALLCCCCLIAVLANQSQRTRSNEEMAPLNAATSWLLKARNRHFHWDDKNADAIGALSLTPTWNVSSAETIVASKQLDIDFLTQRLRNDTWRSEQTLKLALALDASCRDPRNYYGYDLLDVIRNGNETVSHLHYVHLACTLRSNIDKSDVKMLFRSLKSKYCDQISTDADEMLLLIATGNCLAKHYDYSLSSLIDTLSACVISTQLANGSFNNDTVTTSLAVQAVHATNKSSVALQASRWLRSAQRPDGSYGDVTATCHSIKALARMDNTEAQLADRCGQHATLDVGEDQVTSVTFVVWIGQPVTKRYRMHVNVAKNATLLRAMTVAAQMDEKFAFQFKEYPFGSYVTTINTVTEDLRNGWFLYVLPRPLSVTGSKVSDVEFKKFLSKQAIEKLTVAGADTFLFWFKRVQKH